MRVSRRNFVGLSLATAMTPAGGAQTRKSFFQNGAKMVCLSNRGHTQMFGTVLISPDGRVAVIDGGTARETDALASVVAEYGGEVAEWFITHAHSDHLGALSHLLVHPDIRLKRIGCIRFSFPPLEWIQTHEPRRASSVEAFLNAVASSHQKVGCLKVGEVYDLGGGTSIDVLNDFDLSIVNNAINNSSICLSVVHGGRKILVPGDLGREGGERLLRTIPQKLPHEIVFMAHHGQRGVDKSFYKAVNPSVAIWPTPRWLWDNDASLGRLDRAGGVGSGRFQTNYVKCWMQELGVREQYLLTQDKLFA